ncbi:hypothetical protein BJ166DRAFT_497269 [Pestalotiopsis sp. NC0098]|nr:hypothetical protein BJ166DRAFT_497269 [Pestalotiopsis sp. NC0098]
MAMLLYQSEEQAFEIPEVPEQRDLHAVPTGLAPYISPAYHSESVGQSELSEEEMRLRLTDYKCVRFEKPIGQSTWENVVRTNDQGMSKNAIINEIGRLEAATQDVAQKQASLPPALSRHLDMDLEALNENDLNRNYFQWSLAQIDQQVHEIGPDAATERGGKLVQDQGRTPKAPATQQGKKYWQRASITAYFKRSLKPGRAAGSCHEARRSDTEAQGTQRRDSI